MRRSSVRRSLSRVGTRAFAIPIATSNSKSASVFRSVMLRAWNIKRTKSKPIILLTADPPDAGGKTVRPTCSALPLAPRFRSMCNLYSMTTNQQAVLRLFRVIGNRAAHVEQKDAIFPGHQAPVVRRTPDGERELVNLSWGFVLLQPGKAPRRVTNTRDDKVQGRFWRSSFEQRRCLVPASSFCEPNDGRAPGERATWHWFALKGSEPRPPFAFAGIWQTWRGPIKKDGPNIELDVYSFMTTEPNSATASINHERSPILLTTDEARDTWLNGTTKEAFELVRPINGDLLHIVKAGAGKEGLTDVAGQPDTPHRSASSATDFPSRVEWLVRWHIAKYMHHGVVIVPPHALVELPHRRHPCQRSLRLP